MSPETMIYAAVKMTAEVLTDMELASLNLVAAWGTDPRNQAWYPKVKTLFDLENGTKMHQTTQDALARVVNERLK
jgi:hypothetical protein